MNIEQTLKILNDLEKLEKQQNLLNRELSVIKKIKSRKLIKNLLKKTVSENY